MSDDYRLFGLPDSGNPDETPLVYADSPQRAARLAAQDRIDPDYRIEDQTEEEEVLSHAMDKTTELTVYDTATETEHRFAAWTWEVRLPQHHQDEDRFPADISQEDPVYKVEADVEEVTAGGDG